MRRQSFDEDIQISLTRALAEKAQRSGGSCESGPDTAAAAHAHDTAFSDGPPLPSDEESATSTPLGLLFSQIGVVFKCDGARSRSAVGDVSPAVGDNRDNDLQWEPVCTARCPEVWVGIDLENYTDKVIGAYAPELRNSNFGMWQAGPRQQL